MKRFFTFILLLGSLLGFAQSPTLSDFVGKFTFQGFSSGGTSDVTGTLDGFSDQTNQYFASAVQVGDVVWDNLGNRWEVMAVNSSNLLQASVDLRDVNSAGGVPSGVGFVSRETDQIGLSLFVPDNNIGISQQLKSRVESHNMLLLEQYITAHQDSVYQGATASDTSGIADPTTGDVLVTGDGNILFFDGGQWVTFTGGGGGSPDGNGIYSGSGTIPDNTVASFNGGGTSPALSFESGAAVRTAPIFRFKSNGFLIGSNDFDFIDNSGQTYASFATTGNSAGLQFNHASSFAPTSFSIGYNPSGDVLGGRIFFTRNTGVTDYSINIIGTRNVKTTVGSNLFEVGTTAITANSANALTLTGAGLVGLSKTGTAGFLSISAPDDQIIINGEETQIKGDTQVVVQVGLNAEMLVKDDEIYFETVPTGTIDQQLGLDANNQLVKSDPGGGGSDTNIYNADGVIPAATDRLALLDPTATLRLGDTSSVGMSLFPADNIAVFGEPVANPSSFYTGLTVDPLNKVNLISAGNVFVQVEGESAEQISLGCDDTRIVSHTGGYTGLTFDNGGNDYAILTNAITMRFMGNSAVNPIMDISHAAPTSFTINPNGEITFNTYNQSKHDEVLSYGHQVLDQNGVAKKVYDGEFNFRDDANVNALNIHTVIINNSSITLPAASSNTGKIFIIIANSSTTPATPRTIDVSGGGTIQLNPSISMDKPFEVYALVSTGSQYLVLWNKEMAYDLTVRPNNAPHTFASFSSGTNNQNPYDGYTARVNSTTNGNTTTLNLSSANLNPGDAVYVMGAATVSGATVNIGASGGVNIRFKGQLVTNIQLTGPQYIELKLIWTGTEFWAFTSQ